MSTHTLDCCGLKCPEPVMLLHDRLRSLNPGEQLRILATDPGTRQDFQRFCTFLGHELVESDGGVEGKLSYLVTKGGGKALSW